MTEDDITKLWLNSEGKGAAAVVLFARVLVVAEREACAQACEAVHFRPIQGAHEEYMAGKEMTVQQCARAIRIRE